MYYLDNFSSANEADSDKCRLQIEIIKQIFEWFAVLLAPDKITGPTTCLGFLGILIDVIVKNYCHCWNSEQVGKMYKTRAFVSDW